MSQVLWCDIGRHPFPATLDYEVFIGTTVKGGNQTAAIDNSKAMHACSRHPFYAPIEQPEDGDDTSPLPAIERGTYDR